MHLSKLRITENKYYFFLQGFFSPTFSWEGPCQCWLHPVHLPSLSVFDVGHTVQDKYCPSVHLLWSPMITSQISNVSHQLMSNIGQILDKCWLNLSNQTTYKAGFGFKKTVSLHIGRSLLISYMSVISCCPILDKFEFLAKSQQPDHLWGLYWSQKDCIITYWELTFNFRQVSYQLLSNIGQILDKCWNFRKNLRNKMT